MFSGCESLPCGGRSQASPLLSDCGRIPTHIHPPGPPGVIICGIHYEAIPHRGADCSGTWRRSGSHRRRSVCGSPPARILRRQRAFLLRFFVVFCAICCVSFWSSSVIRRFVQLEQRHADDFVGGGRDADSGLIERIQNFAADLSP